MKKNELVLGNVVRAYKGNEDLTITAIGEEVVTLNDTKEVKISTLLKNYKLVEEIPVEATFNGEPPIAIEEEVDDSEATDSLDETIEALVEEIEDRQSERPFLDEVNDLLADDANEENDVEVVEDEEPVVEASQAVETEEAVKEKTPEKNAKTKKENEIIYGVKVANGINQTLIWKVLKKVCENKDDEGIKIANELRVKHPDEFKGALKCLVSKKRIAYINSISQD